ncbi:MAG: type II toxin-antitoxin system RelE/ParE family toxin [Minicystis sp.]
MTRLIVRTKAELDIQEATDWYEEEEPGLGARFVDELSSTLNRIRVMPLQFPSVGQGARRALLKRFPYAIYFVLRDADQAVIIAVLHQRRAPSVWKQRTRGE